MSKVITFSQKFPAYHPCAGQPTLFVENTLNQLGIDYHDTDYYHSLFELNKVKYNAFTIPRMSNFWVFLGIQLDPAFTLKHHTIRAGHRFKAGDKFSPRVWSGKPYHSKQIIIAPDIEICSVWDIQYSPITGWHMPAANATTIIETIAKNDGLEYPDLQAWFPKPFAGQIICWNPDIQY